MVDATIKLRDLIGQFTDYRGGYFGNAPVWGTSTSQSGLDYEEYYSPSGMNRFYVSIPNLNVGDYLSQNRDVLTNLNQSSPDRWVPLSNVYSTLYFKVTAPGEITYYNNGAQLSGSFQIKIPLAIDYYWGTLHERVIITIGNSNAVN
jgi:hypothetical protein